MVKYGKIVIMQMFDFTTVLDRKGHDALAYDNIPESFKNIEIPTGTDIIPMWVADMSFKCCPAILEAVKNRLKMPNFGYFNLSETYYERIISWHEKYKDGFGITKESLGYENGVLGGVATAICTFTQPGESVLVHSPTYCGFISVFRDTGRNIITSNLYMDKDNIWRMDYEDMDRKIKENNIRLAIFCSPHNPTGRVWERSEIEKAMEIYRENNCTVISDEIWSDIIMPGYKHIPTQNISEDAKNRTIAFYAPSKTFSIAGLIGSYHVVFNKNLKNRLEEKSRMTHYNDCNVLSMHALTGAYSEAGRMWTDQMIDTVNKNIEFAIGWFRNHTPEIKVMRSQGTYMLFVLLEPWCKAHNVSVRKIQERAIKAGVIWQSGSDFFVPDAVRMNLALPFSQLEKAFGRLETVFTF